MDRWLDANGLSVIRGYSLQGSFDAGAVTGAVPLYGMEEPVYPLGPANDAIRRGSRFTIRTA
ncbi:hypothetical protein ACP3TJ_08495 [Desulforudis sp. 1088]|uniref:hypothetical protein n=1 Tax=unclassified Candidatus Desulforudis TaxID=2635950 RepID=UPI003CE5B0ED